MLIFISVLEGRENSAAGCNKSSAAMLPPVSAVKMQCGGGVKLLQPWQLNRGNIPAF